MTDGFGTPDLIPPPKDGFSTPGTARKWPRGYIIDVTNQDLPRTQRRRLGALMHALKRPGPTPDTGDNDPDRIPPW